MKVESTVQIAATPEDVYRVVMDPSRLDDWVSIHDSLPSAPDGELEKGSRLTQRLRLARQRITVRWQVTEDDRPRRVVWEGKGPFRAHARAVYELAESDGGTRFHYENEFDLPGGPAGRLAGRGFGRTAEREMKQSLDRLKTLVEDEAG